MTEAWCCSRTRRATRVIPILTNIGLQLPGIFVGIVP